MWWQSLVAVLGGLLLVWIVLLGLLWLTQRNHPGATGISEALRLLPDVIRLLRRLAADPALPRGVRVRLWLLLAYLLLPIDLIPDFIPVLGLLDDAILVPAGIWLFVKMVPPYVFEEHRAQAAAAAERPGSVWGAVVVVVVWVLAALLAARLLGFL